MSVRAHVLEFWTFQQHNFTVDCSQIAGAGSVSTCIIEICGYRGGHFQSHSAVGLDASFRDELCFSLAVCQME